MADPRQIGPRGNMWGIFKAAIESGLSYLFPVARIDGTGLVAVAKFTYSFTVDGGLVSTITPLGSPTIPVGAILLGGVVDVTTPITGGASTIALGIGTGAQAAVLKAATAIASYTAVALPLIPLFSGATYYKVTAAGKLSLTIAGAALTAGKFDVNVLYVIGN